MTTSQRPAPAQSDEIDIAKAVAGNLKRLRTERGLSLEALAERSGVSRAMLNQIENSKSVPTITILWKVASGLNLPFSQLIGVERRTAARVIPSSSAKWLANAGHTFESRALFPLDGGPRMSEFYEIRIQPGGVEEAEPHPRGTIEHLVLVRGAAEIVVGDASFNLRPNDAFFFQADVPHTYRNTSVVGEALLYLVMTYPQPVTF